MEIENRFRDIPFTHMNSNTSHRLALTKKKSRTVELVGVRLVIAVIIAQYSSKDCSSLQQVVVLSSQLSYYFISIFSFFL